MNKHDSRRTTRINKPLNRRSFIAAGAAAASVVIVEPGQVRGSQANSKIEIGVIGSGNRGRWIADLFNKHGQYKVVTACDYFEDRVDEVGEQFGVDPARRYTGLSGHRGLLASKPDAVVIETPPYFHPQHATDAVEAGCHVFQAKPLAVDVPGCLAFSAAGKKATRKNLCFLVDFQTRASELYQEAVRRVHAGDIGQIVNGEAVYYAGPTWKRHVNTLQEDPNSTELKLRAWGINRTLSGDIITEQNIHALDVASWILDAEPVKAYGTGSRKARTEEPGDCYDNFEIVFRFPDDVVLSFTSGQFSKGYSDIGCRVFGPDGSVDTHYFGEVSIIGNNPYQGGPVESLFANGVTNNIAEFHRAITEGDYSNPTVEPSVRSNLTTILGRTAAYKQREVTWKEVIQANEKWEFDSLDELSS